MTQKWIQKVEERQEHLNCTHDMTNMYLTYSDEEATVDFVNDHEELYHRTNEHYKDKARKDCLFERGSPTVASCLSKCGRPGLNRKGRVKASSRDPSLDSR